MKNILLLSTIYPLPVLPSVLCHCDLHFGNTLVDSNSIYLIDFENVREDVFFYDLFNILFVEYIDKDNPYFIEEYFKENSEVDDLFKQSFQAVGEELEERNKVLYFVVFLHSRLTHNVSYLGYRSYAQAEPRWGRRVFHTA